MEKIKGTKFRHWFDPLQYANMRKPYSDEWQLKWNKALKESLESRKPRAYGMAFTKPSSPPSAITRCTLPDGRTGWSWCARREGNWNRRLGNKIAYQRAVNQEIPHEV